MSTVNAPADLTAKIREAVAAEACAFDDLVDRILLDAGQSLVAASRRRRE